MRRSVSGHDEGRLCAVLLWCRHHLGTGGDAGEQRRFLSTKQIWLPPGAWYDVVAGSLVQSPTPCGQTITRHYALEDQPMFVRGGAIVPRRILTNQLLGTARSAYDALEFTVYPGGCGSLSLYEDDAETTAYATTGDFSEQTVRVYAVQRRAGVDQDRCGAGEWRLFGAGLAACRGALSADRYRAAGGGRRQHAPVVALRSSSGGPSWHYDARDMSVVVDCGQLSTTVVHDVMVTQRANIDVDGISGILNRAELAKSLLDQARETPGSDDTTSQNLMLLAAQSAHLSAINWNASGFAAAVTNVRALAVAAVAELQSKRPPAANALVQMFSSMRGDNVLCANRNCLAANDASDGYVQLRIEGFQPTTTTTAPTTKLVALWNPNVPDNFAVDPSYNVPNGYTPAVFQGGVAFTQSAAGLLPLRVFWNGRDFLTVASSAGVAWAQAHNYTDMQHVAGYVYAQQPTSNGTSVDDRRWNTALSLLQHF
jgi:hypothetical protein